MQAGFQVGKSVVYKTEYMDGSELFAWDSFLSAGTLKASQYTEAMAKVNMRLFGFASYDYNSINCLVRLVQFQLREEIQLRWKGRDDRTRGNAFCFWVADYRWRGGYAHRIARAEEEIRSIRREAIRTIRQSRPVNRSSTTSGKKEIEVNLNRDSCFQRKTEWAYDPCSFPFP